MPWAQFDDRYATHRKMLAAGLEATGLDARAICQSAGDLTDGFVSDAQLDVLATGSRTKPKKLAEKLVEVGRWTRDDARGGWWIHDYLVYNPSREQVEAKREKERERKAEGRRNQGRSQNGRITSVRNPQHVQPESEALPPHGDPESAAECGSVPPVPPLPVPTTNKSSSNHHGVGAGHPDDDDVDRRVREAAELQARRRAATAQGVRKPSAYVAATTAQLVRDHGDELRQLATMPDLSVEEIAATLDEAPATNGRSAADEHVSAEWERAKRNARIASEPPCPKCDSTGFVETEDGAVVCAEPECPARVTA